MDDQDIKETAESVLRELPGVVGAFVQPDAFGHPREIHLLIQPGAQPREFAQQVRSVLESRLRIPIDKRIISIAQLADERGDGAAADAVARPDAGSRAGDRCRLVGLETDVAGRRAIVRLRVTFDGEEIVGEGSDIEAPDGRARAAALAAVDAVNRICGDQARFGVEFATLVEAVGEPYVLVSVAVTSPHLGRRAVNLHAANPVVEEDTGTAAALSVLKATNRVLAFVLGRVDRRQRFPTRPNQG